MKALAEKLRGLEQKIADEKGPFNLFALFLREGAPNVWDLVVAAEWIDLDQSEALVDISQRVSAYLLPEEIVRIARVVIVDRSNPEVGAIAAAVSGSRDIVEVSNRTFFDLAMKRGFIIVAQVDSPPSKVSQRTAAVGGRR